MFRRLRRQVIDFFGDADPIEVMIASIVVVSLAIVLLSVVMVLSSCSKPLPEVRFNVPIASPDPTAPGDDEPDTLSTLTSASMFGSIREALFISGRQCGWIRSTRTGAIEWEPCAEVRAFLERGAS